MLYWYRNNRPGIKANFFQLINNPVALNANFEQQHNGSNGVHTKAKKVKSRWTCTKGLTSSLKWTEPTPSYWSHFRIIHTLRLFFFNRQNIRSPFATKLSPNSLRCSSENPQRPSATVPRLFILTSSQSCESSSCWIASFSKSWMLKFESFLF